MGIIDNRLIICESCEHIVQSMAGYKKCGLCGCSIYGLAVVNRCKEDKWTEINQSKDNQSITGN